MTTNDLKLYYARMTTAIRRSDISEIRKVFAEYPNAKDAVTPSGSWLAIAARQPEPAALEFLISAGVDHSVGDRDSGKNALSIAAGKGLLQNVMRLHDYGAELDTSSSTSNTLISAVFARSVPVAEYLLDAGIDARVDYQMAPGVRYDALCFALEQGAREVANVIALHLAGGDKPGAQAELDRAWAAVKAGNPNAKTWPEAPVI